MEQKIIFMCEMQGQLSDGYWENTHPLDHWKIWRDLKWNDIKIGEQIGAKDISPWAKRNYNFSARQLLEVVGNRLRFKIVLFKLFPNVVGPLLELNHHLIPDTLEDFQQWPKEKEYWGCKRDTLIAAGLTVEKMQLVTDKMDELYSNTDLRRDCKGLKQAFKIVNIK
jgi:hypothetical protein